jgi:rubrerythrin
MVDKLWKKGKIVYLCELCGYGYKALENAEQCEEYCNTHESYSPEIHKQAIRKPTVPLMPLAA